MPTYVMLANFTDQGIRNVRDVPQRWDAGRKAIEAAGGSIQFFLTMGQYDLVAIIDLPNDEAAATLALGIGSQGNIRTTTLKGFTEDEARKVFAAIPAA